MLRFLTRSIPGRILAALVSIYVATYFATAVVVYSGVRASILDSDAAALNQLADLKYAQLVGTIGSLATDLTAWSELEVMNDLVSGDIDQRVAQTLDGLKRLYGLSGDIYAFDASGKLLASSANGRAATARERLPAEWQDREQHLTFIDKAVDPMTGEEIIALEIPVFGTFDRGFRIGTLVLTYPWSSVERLVFGLGSGTILLEQGERTRILVAGPAGLAAEAGFDVASSEDGHAGASFVIGRSVPRPGLLDHWQVLTLQKSTVATRPLHRVAFELLLLGAFLSFPILLLGRWLSRRLTAPIAILTRVAGEIADTEKLDARVPVTSSDELGSLARSFNRMTESLEQTTREREQFLRELAALNQTLEAKIASRTQELQEAIRAQQRLIGDISHEIKSPLARLSMALGLARRSEEPNRDRQFDRIEREVQNISALASELLTLARLDAAALPEFGATDLGCLIDEVVTDALYETPERAPDVTWRAPGEPLLVLGNWDLLRRAIENVVRNALFYTTMKTGIEISLMRKTPTLLTVAVRDHGPGVPDGALPHLFEPFYRVDEARARTTGGTGVGLAICQRVVQRHGGSVRAMHNRPQGLVIEIDLPSVPSPA